MSRGASSTKQLLPFLATGEPSSGDLYGSSLPRDLSCSTFRDAAGSPMPFFIVGANSLGLLRGSSVSLCLFLGSRLNLVTTVGGASVGVLYVFCRGVSVLSVLYCLVVSVRGVFAPRRYGGVDKI